MGLQSNIMTYIRFFTLLTPVIIPTMALFGSLYESDLKGFIYILGLTFTMFIGKLLSSTIGSKIPGSSHTKKASSRINDDNIDGASKHNEEKQEDSINDLNIFNPIADAACTIINDSDWGRLYGMPAPNALMLAFTATYMMFPMFINDNVSLLTIGGLIFLLIVNAIVRVLPPMSCVYPTQILVGWVTGFLLGTIYYFIVTWLAHSQNNNTIRGITYFEKKKGDKQQCVLDKKAFRCKKERKAN